MAKGNVAQAKNKESEIEKSKRILAEEKKKVEEICLKEFQALLKKHNCTVSISGSFFGSQIQYGIHFVLKQS